MFSTDGAVEILEDDKKYRERISCLLKGYEVCGEGAEEEAPDLRVERD